MSVYIQVGNFCADKQLGNNPASTQQPPLQFGSAWTESLIWRSAWKLAIAETDAQKKAARDELKRLHVMRTPAQVEQLERERRLR